MIFGDAGSGLRMTDDLLNVCSCEQIVLHECIRSNPMSPMILYFVAIIVFVLSKITVFQNIYPSIIYTKNSPNLSLKMQLFFIFFVNGLILATKIINNRLRCPCAANTLPCDSRTFPYKRYCTTLSKFAFSQFLE